MAMVAGDKTRRNIGDAISSSYSLHGEAFLGKILNSKFPSINTSECERACEF